MEVYEHIAKNQNVLRQMDQKLWPICQISRILEFESRFYHIWIAHKNWTIRDSTILFGSLPMFWGSSNPLRPSRTFYHQWFKSYGPRPILVNFKNSRGGEGALDFKIKKKKLLHCFSYLLATFRKYLTSFKKTFLKSGYFEPP